MKPACTPWRIHAVVVVILGLALSPPCIQAQSTNNFGDRQALRLNVSPHVYLTNFVFNNDGDNFRQMFGWKNTTPQPVVALEIVTLKFDPFNRALRPTRIVVPGKPVDSWAALQPERMASDEWLVRGEEMVFTAIAYVGAVRLADGTVWRPTDAAVLAALKDAAPGLRAQNGLPPSADGTP
jgi:hypothetical protein